MMGRLAATGWAVASALAFCGCNWNVGSLDVILVYTSDESNLPLDPSSVKSLRVSLKGDGFTKREEVFPLHAAGTAVLDNIPLGKNRVVTVEGLNAAGSPFSRGVSAPFETREGGNRLFLFISTLGRVGQFSGPPVVNEADKPEWQASFQTDSRARKGRTFHTATLLPEGTVLVTGGVDQGETIDPLARVPDGSALQSAERFDATAGAFRLDVEGETCTSGDELCLNVERAFHTATLSSDGKSLLVVGGEPLNAVSAEYYDTAKLTFSGARDIQPRTRHGAAAEAGAVKKILFAGGINEASELMDNLDEFDEQSGMFGRLGVSLSTARSGAKVVAYPGGAVVIGGWENWEQWPSSGMPNRIASTKVDRLDLTGEVPNLTSFDLGHARAEHTAVLLPPTSNDPDPRVLVCGGLRDATLVEETCELVRPLEDSSTLLEIEPVSRWQHSATVLQDGRVLIAGGFYPGVSPSAMNLALLISPDGGWSREPIPMISRRAGHTATLLDNGMVVVIGGMAAAGQMASTPYEIFNPRPL